MRKFIFNHFTDKFWGNFAQILDLIDEGLPGVQTVECSILRYIASHPNLLYCFISTKFVFETVL